MIKFELSNPIVLKTVINSLNEITSECGILFTNDELKINALSKDHTTFINIDLKKYLFDEYECSTDEVITVDVYQLNNIMKRCKNTDRITCNIDDNNFNLIFHGDSTRAFTTRLIDNEYETPKPPIINYTYKVDLPTNVFQDSLNDLKIFSDVIRISMDNDYLLFKSEGQAGDGLIKYLHGENIQDYLESQYSIEKLSQIMKAKDFSETITMKLGDNLPLSIKFKLVTGDGEMGFLVAPRISE